MARPKTAFPPAEAVMRLANDQRVIEIRVQPNAAADAVILPAAPSMALVIRTTATPEGGKANDAVLRLLSRTLDVAPSSLELVRGATSRTKFVRIAVVP